MQREVPTFRLIEEMDHLVLNQMAHQLKDLHLELELEDITIHLQTEDQEHHLSRQELDHKELNLIDSGHHFQTMAIPPSLNQSLCNPKVLLAADRLDHKDRKIQTPQTECIHQTVVQELMVLSQAVFMEVKLTVEAVVLIGSEENRLLWVLQTLIAEVILEVVHP